MSDVEVTEVEGDREPVRKRLRPWELAVARVVALLLIGGAMVECQSRVGYSAALSYLNQCRTKGQSESAAELRKRLGGPACFKPGAAGPRNFVGRLTERQAPLFIVARSEVSCAAHPA